jgi:hypothetical protein
MRKIYHIPNLYRKILYENENTLNKLGWEYKITQEKGTFVQIQIFTEPYFHKTSLNEDDVIFYLQQIY